MWKTHTKADHCPRETMDFQNQFTLFYPRVSRPNNVVMFDVSKKHCQKPQWQVSWEKGDVLNHWGSGFSWYCMFKQTHARWCPPVISWFINIVGICRYVDISTINHSYWSYVHQLSKRTGAPPWWEPTPQVPQLPHTYYYKGLFVNGWG